MNWLASSTFVLALGLVTTSFAAPLTVESGEHSDFTRLVTPLPRDKNWSIKQNGNQVVLTFDGHADGFETNDVFDLIPRSRIASVTSNASRLTLALACDCNVATFIENDLYLVIDVATKSVQLIGSVVPTVQSALSEQTTSAASPSSATRMSQTIPLLPLTRHTTSPSLNFPQPVLGRPTLRAEEQQILAEMQQRLAQELGVAATRGFLTPTPGQEIKKPSQMATIQSEQKTELPDPVAPEIGPLGNVRISSSIDLPSGTTDSESMLNTSRLSCPRPGNMDVSTWGSSDPFAEQIASSRENLFNALDRLNHSVAVNLAKHYLFFGFGAEARQVLRMDSSLIDENQTLLIIADILDGVQPTLPNTLARQMTCDPEIVLWAILAQPDPVTGAKPDVDAAIRTLSKLPPHLRQILAPALSKKLLAYGDDKGAEMALRSLNRLPDPLESAGKLAQAELDLHNGDAERGTAQLEVVADENSALSPVALIALIDAKVDAKQPIDVDATNLVAAYAKELSGTELGPEMRRVHVLALLKSGQFDAAFEANQELGGNDNTKASAHLRVQLLRDLTDAADDIVFLDHIFSQREADIASLAPRDLTALAARFLATGFAERAEVTLGHLPQSSLQSDQQLLAARIALALEKPYMAQANLLGIQGDQADSLRAQAKHLAGAHEEAHDLYVQASKPQDAAEMAWLAEGWRGLTTTETPVFGPTSNLAAISSGPSDGAIGMLARTAAALDESQAARQTLVDLLNDDALRVGQ